MKRAWIVCIAWGIASAAFVPTTEWQPVGPDDELPPGLHVRLNIYTGEKEAKLLDPADGNDNTGIIVQAVSGEESVVVPLDESTIHWPGDELVGVGADHSELETTMALLRARKPVYHAQLDQMAELAHDIEYGEVIAGGCAAQLLDLAVDSDASSDLREAACRALGASLRNNPKSQALVFGSHLKIVDRVLAALEDPANTPLYGRLLYVLSSSLTHGGAVEQFRAADGGSVIRRVFANGTPAIKAKCCSLAHDHVVDTLHAERRGDLDPSRQSHVSWARDESRRWAVALQQALADTRPGVYSGLKDQLLRTLVSIKEPTVDADRFDIPSSDDFIAWLDSEATRKPADADEEPYYSEVARVRHLVFGNPLAARNQHLDDL